MFWNGSLFDWFLSVIILVWIIYICVPVLLIFIFCYCLSVATFNCEWQGHCCFTKSTLFCLKVKTLSHWGGSV